MQVKLKQAVETHNTRLTGLLSTSSPWSSFIGTFKGKSTYEPLG